MILTKTIFGIRKCFIFKFKKTSKQTTSKRTAQGKRIRYRDNCNTEGRTHDEGTNFDFVSSTDMVKRSLNVIFDKNQKRELPKGNRLRSCVSHYHTCSMGFCRPPVVVCKTYVSQTPRVLSPNFGEIAIHYIFTHLIYNLICVCFRFSMQTNHAHKSENEKAPTTNRFVNRSSVFISW